MAGRSLLMVVVMVGGLMGTAASPITSTPPISQVTDVPLKGMGVWQVSHHIPLVEFGTALISPGSVPSGSQSTHVVLRVSYNTKDISDSPVNKTSLLRLLRANLRRLLSPNLRRLLSPNLRRLLRANLLRLLRPYVRRLLRANLRRLLRPYVRRLLKANLRARDKEEIPATPLMHFLGEHLGATDSLQEEDESRSTAVRQLLWGHLRASESPQQEYDSPCTLLNSIGQEVNRGWGEDALQGGSQDSANPWLELVLRHIRDKLLRVVMEEWGFAVDFALLSWEDEPHFRYRRQAETEDDEEDEDDEDDQVEKLEKLANTNTADILYIKFVTDQVVSSIITVKGSLVNYAFELVGLSGLLSTGEIVGLIWTWYDQFVAVRKWVTDNYYID